MMNPLFNMFGNQQGPFNNMNNVIDQFNQFQSTFSTLLFGVSNSVFILHD